MGLKIEISKIRFDLEYHETPHRPARTPAMYVLPTPTFTTYNVIDIPILEQHKISANNSGRNNVYTSGCNASLPKKTEINIFKFFFSASNFPSNKSRPTIRAEFFKFLGIFCCTKY